jgi:hypothetical protein
MDQLDPGLPCEVDDFDPYVKYGRDNLLFVKRQAMNSLLKTTRYTEAEIKNLMTMYVQMAEPKKGMNMRQFDKFWFQMTNI